MNKEIAQTVGCSVRLGSQSCLLHYELLSKIISSVSSRVHKVSQQNMRRQINAPADIMKICCSVIEFNPALKTFILTMELCKHRASHLIKKIINVDWLRIQKVTEIYLEGLSWRIFLFPWLDSPQWARASQLSRFHGHNQKHHTCQDYSGPVISPKQRHLPHNTQHSEKRDIYALGRIRTRNPGT